MINKYREKFTHILVDNIACEIEKNINLVRDENGYKRWYTDNWCFDGNLKKNFYCKYFFYFTKGSDEIKKLEKYLLDNNIQYNIRYEAKDNCVVFDYTDKIIKVKF